MPTLYKYNENRIFSGAIEVPEGISYSNTTTIKPDESLKVPKWMGTGLGWQENIVRHKTYLNVTADKEIYNVNENITINATVKNNNQLVPLTADYYVPVIRDSDGKQVDFLTISFINGESLFTFSISEKGKYLINMDKITPTPKSVLSKNLNLIIV